jgi:hypothetical protein
MGLLGTSILFEGREFVLSFPCGRHAVWLRFSGDTLVKRACDWLSLQSRSRPN